MGTPPDPLTDLSAAFAALEAWVKKSGADYGCLEFGFDSEKMYWNVIIGPKHSASGDSLPLAICKALAKAIGGGGGEDGEGGVMTDPFKSEPRDPEWIAVHCVKQIGFHPKELYEARVSLLSYSIQDHYRARAVGGPWYNRNGKRLNDRQVREVVLKWSFRDESKSDADFAASLFREVEGLHA